MHHFARSKQGKKYFYEEKKMKNVVRFILPILAIGILVGLGKLNWTLLSPDISPSPRTQHNMVFDAARQEILMFGGSIYGQMLNETWGWNGLTWQIKSPAHKPMGRVYHALAYDKIHDVVVLFGGYPKTLGYYTGLNDTWIWDGCDWLEMDPPNRPSPRELATMAFDEARGEAVLFGGGIPNTYVYYNDTWAWDGANWTELQPVTRPSARVEAKMVYDRKNQEIVLFGGLTSAGQWLNETWIWNGTNWEKQNPAMSPSTRDGFALVYDDRLKRVVCFGGYDHPRSLKLNDTWAWDGMTWEQIFPDSTPSARYGHQMAYDDSRSESLLFGGYDNSNWLQDTWILKAANSPPIAVCKNVEIAAGDDCRAWIGAKDIDNGSYDPDGEELTYEVDYSGPFFFGEERLVTLTVTDGHGASDSCQAKVKVVDQAAPVPSLAVLPTIIGECAVAVTSSPTATDACAGQIVGTTSDPREYSQQGEYTITWTYDDGHGNATTQKQTVIVQDVTAPVIENKITTPELLWPPNHKMIPILVSVTATDNCARPVENRIVSVTSNEPQDGLGDGDTAPDWEITGPLSLNLRAERSGIGSGRVYTITIQSRDQAGNVSTGIVTVSVPKNK
jgi:hypothetical protein